MTARSERRAAEMAIIEAAYYCEEQWRNPVLGRTAAARLRLEQALRAHRLLGLQEPAKPRANVRSPETAHEAAEWMKPRAERLLGKVFLAIHLSGNIGMTTDQVQQRLSGQHQSVSPRVTELRDAGWITDSGRRRRTRTGRDAVVWISSDLAREAAPLAWRERDEEG